MRSDNSTTEIHTPLYDGDTKITPPNSLIIEPLSSGNKSVSSTMPLRRSLPSCGGDDHQDVGNGGGARSTSSLANNDNNNSSSGSRPSRRVRIISNRFALLSELSGACGDFGTLIPLLVAMARLRTIYLAPTLFLTGIVHIVTGWYWDIPMPLQPMKAIASLAIAQELTRQQVTTAGMGVGACFLILSMGNFIEVVNRWIPQAVISGLQLGVGWKLALKGIQMIQDLPWWFSSRSVDCITLSVLCGALCLYGLRRGSPAESRSSGVDGTRSTTTSSVGVDENETADPNDGQQQNVCHETYTRNEVTSQSLCQNILDKPPVGIVLFLLGIILAAVQLRLKESDDSGNDVPNNISMSEPLIVNALQTVTAKDWWIGLLSGTLTQIPLSTLNSCLSVCLLAQSLFPGHVGRRVSRRSVCISMGLINCVLCPLGCMPSCHGKSPRGGTIYSLTYVLKSSGQYTSFSVATLLHYCITRGWGTSRST
jgi:hypothetical protein